LRLHGIESAVRSIEKAADGIGLAGITGNANTDGKARLFGIRVEEITNAPRDQGSGSHARFRKDDSEFITAMTSGGVRVAAGVLEDLCEPAECAAAGKMTELIVDLF